MLTFLISHWAWFGGLGSAGAIIGGLLSFVGPTALLAHWKAIVAAILALVVVAVVVTLYIMLEHSRLALSNEQTAFAKLNGNYQTVEQQNTVLSASNSNLGLIVSTQSKSIDIVAQQGQQQKAEAEAALAAALAKQTNDKQTITRLTARINNPTTNGSCEDEINAISTAL
jgi:hypothetical protein